MSTRHEITQDNICDDDLWYAAGLEVKGERLGWAELNPREYADYKEIFAIIINNREIEREYYGILECQFENFDADN